MKRKGAREKSKSEGIRLKSVHRPRRGLSVRYWSNSRELEGRRLERYRDLCDCDFDNAGVGQLRIPAVKARRFGRGDSRMYYASGGTRFMQNISYMVQGDYLIIKVDLTKRLGPSSTGKTVMIAKGSGVKVDQNIGFGLNVYTKEGM